MTCLKPAFCLRTNSCDGNSYGFKKTYSPLEISYGPKIYGATSLVLADKFVLHLFIQIKK